MRQLFFFCFGYGLQTIFRAVSHQIHILILEIRQQQHTRFTTTAIKFQPAAMSNNIPHHIGDKLTVFRTDIFAITQIFFQNIVSRILILKNLANYL